MTGNWMTSSFSFSNSNCVQARWRKSSASMCNGHCAEARTDGGVVQLRDSKNPGGAILSFTPEAWTAFIAAVKATLRP